MTDWTEALDALASACVDVFADEVTLPSGSVVWGVFDPIGQPPASPWSEVGLSIRVSQQPSPRVWLLDATAASLAVGDRVLIDGASYQVTAPARADGSGLTPVELQQISIPNADATRWQ